MLLIPAADVVSATALRAMDGLSTRQEVLADNLANSTTPFFRASKVDFESSLAASVAATGSPSGMDITVSDAGTPANADGNTVDVAGDTLRMQETQVAFEANVAAFNFRMSIEADGLNR